MHWLLGVFLEGSTSGNYVGPRNKPAYPDVNDPTLRTQLARITTDTWCLEAASVLFSAAGHENGLFEAYERV